MAESKIEWTQKVWNPVTGCSKVSQGCKNCYAEKMHKRLRAMGIKKYSEPFNKVVCHKDQSDYPHRFKTPTTFFVNSMSDLFHPDVPDRFIADVFETMAAYPIVCRKKDCEHDDPDCLMGASLKNHTYLILTKRPDRAKKFLTETIYEITEKWPGDNPLNIMLDEGPLPNVWIGTSIEDQATADERIPTLIQIPAAKRFISCEPLLGEIETFFTLDKICLNCGEQYPTNRHDREYEKRICVGCDNPTELVTRKIDLVIVGGESGPSARPMHPDWVRKIRDDCKAADVPFFFKQWGGKNKKKAGAILDGEEYKEVPW